MIYVGIDDTDIAGSPGTNQFCRALIRDLPDPYRCHLIVRHQLLVDDRVPYTSKNSCALIQLHVRQTHSPNADEPASLSDLIQLIRDYLHTHFIQGSDPGFCITRKVPSEVSEFGKACQHHVVTQSSARTLADSHGLHLEGCGGTNDGVIGALAAVGLAAMGSDGRVVQLGIWPDDLAGRQPVRMLRQRDVNVVSHRSHQSIESGTVDVGKHLRPNYRNHQVVLYAEPTSYPTNWRAVRLP